MRNISQKTTLILNADDPQVAFLADNSKAKVYISALIIKMMIQNLNMHLIPHIVQNVKQN